MTKKNRRRAHVLLRIYRVVDEITKSVSFFPYPIAMSPDIDGLIRQTISKQIEKTNREYMERFPSILDDLLNSM